MTSRHSPTRCTRHPDLVQVDPAELPEGMVDVGRRGHLRVLRDNT
jgi:hypothetical protein